MTNSAILQRSKAATKARPDIKTGFTVRVHERIQEGGKERIQIFEGLVIAMHKGSTPMDSTITVRRIVSGVGTEKLFPIHSLTIDKIDVKKVAKVRRAKLFFLRNRRGKSARLSERFTVASEFADATAGSDSTTAVEDDILETKEELVAESNTTPAAAPSTAEDAKEKETEDQ
jgi:large subunit ribosomal protein L19